MGDERLLATFFDLVRLCSPSYRERSVAEYAADALAEAGAEVRFDGSAARTGSDTGNLLASLSGGAGPVLVLSAHMDTVEPCEGVEPILEDGAIRSKGGTVLGADDKAGVAVILETVRRLVESDAPRPAIRIVLTVGEEKGLAGAKALDETDLEGDVCLVLDADGAPGGVVVASPTHYTFQADFKGRAAHAGVEPEKGRSALRMAAEAVAAMPQGRLDERTTANVGTVDGGSATNVVAPAATVTGECRSIDAERVEEVRSAMTRALEEAAERGEGRVEIVWSKEYEGFSFDEDDEAVRLVTEACEDAGLEPRTFSTGGGSDGNILHAKGLKTLVLSSGMQEVHGIDEFILEEHLYQMALLLEAIVRRAAEGAGAAGSR